MFHQIIIKNHSVLSETFEKKFSTFWTSILSKSVFWILYTDKVSFMYISKSCWYNNQKF